MRSNLPTDTKDFYRKFLAEVLPIEPHLPMYVLHNYFLAEIAVRTIENDRDAMVILMGTYSTGI